MEIATEQKNLECFGELVLADPDLHNRLRATVGIADFALLAVQLGAERGCDFSVQVVQEAVMEKRRAWLERWI